MVAEFVFFGTDLTPEIAICSKRLQNVPRQTLKMSNTPNRWYENSAAQTSNVIVNLLLCKHDTSFVVFDVVKVFNRSTSYIYVLLAVRTNCMPGKTILPHQTQLQRYLQYFHTHLNCISYPGKRQVTVPTRMQVRFNYRTTRSTSYRTYELHETTTRQQ
jgi:glutathione peroxidase-family protein